MAQLSHSSEREVEVRFNQPAGQTKLTAITRWLLQNWEIALILFLSIFLHLINIDRAIFNDDEVNVFRMAHDAIASGWLPLTSNRASLGNLNPPLVVYFFMLPASLSANPLWAEIMVALLNAAAVLLTCVFVRRYYGRLAGVIAALLYATSAGAWTFSRNIWPQNFLPFFVLLFLVMLFRGVVERRKGWLFWSILLFGVLYQLHGSSLYLLIPLAAAVVFAYKTIRVRDIVLGIVALLVLFSPYIIWEFHSSFADVAVLFQSTNQQAHTDTEALHFYLFFLHPYLVSPYVDIGARIRDTHLLVPGKQSILAHSHLLTLLSAVYLLSIVLLLGGVLLAVARIFAVRAVPAAERGKNIVARWWTGLWASPSRQGLVLLLLWQVAPLLFLLHHSIVLFVHYFIVFLPGQFILMALCGAQIIDVVKRFRPAWERITRYAATALAVLVILAQLVGLGGTIIDLSTGHFQSEIASDMTGQQDALQLADQIARQRHIQRIYLTSFPTYIKVSAMQYLARQIKTPVEFFTSEDCFILPSPDAGPVLFLTNSGNSLAETLFGEYADATLVATSPHLGTSPYRIYMVTAKPEPAPVPRAFNQSLQLLSPDARLIQDRWLVTRWRVLNAHLPAFRTNYGFDFQVRSVAGASLNDDLECTPASTWAGDQLFAFDTIQPGSFFPSQIAVQVSTFISRPQTFALGPVTGFAYSNKNTAWQALLANDGKKSVLLPTTISGVN